MSHFTERMEERLRIKCGPVELAELEEMLRRGGPNVKLQRTRMQAICEYEIAWRDKVFVVIYNRSRGEFVTAFQVASPTIRSKGVLYPGEKRRVRLSVRDVDCSEE